MFSIRCLFGRHAPGAWSVTLLRVDRDRNAIEYDTPFICPRCERRLPEPAPVDCMAELRLAVSRSQPVKEYDDAN